MSNLFAPEPEDALISFCTEQFALTEASYVIVRLLQRFDKLENLETDPVTRHNLTLTNCSGNGVKVRLHQDASVSFDHRNPVSSFRNSQ